MTRRSLCLAAFLAASLPACVHHGATTASSSTSPAPLSPPTARAARSETGVASFYGRELAGHPTANGERFDPTQMTCAHRTFPFDTRLRVTNLANGKTVIVRVNDRGPFTKKRLLDVSEAAARELGMLTAGTARVRIEVIGDVP